MAPTLQSKSSAAWHAASERVVERDPERLGGVPVFRGTRVPVKSLFDHLHAGDSLETFLDDFPGVTRAQAETVIDLAAERLIAEVDAR